MRVAKDERLDVAPRAEQSEQFLGILQARDILTHARIVMHHHDCGTIEACIEGLFEPLQLLTAEQTRG
jgi:hypothetical protein